MPETNGLGPLAAALAKAQGEFGTVTKNKTVTVQKKTGGSYSFAYAPLDTILDATRGPLAKNGLVVAQLLDSEELVTMLIHDSGASLEAHTPLPSTADIQGYGSAITYLRRYAIQALLGIAAEDDDDGNRAAGNQAVPRVAETTTDGGLIGVVEVGKTRDADFEVRKSGDDDHFALGFKLKSNGGGFKVLTRDELALQLLDAKERVVGKRVTVWGRISDVTPGPTDKWRAYQVIAADRVKTEVGTLPAVSPLREDEPEPIAPGQEVLPLDDEERALVGGVG